ncbi:MBL fold metallo-hydrolase [Spirosoma telluris]
MATTKKKGIDMISHVNVRMYRMGTGDCFILKFFTGETNNTFTMMIDCGTWRQTDDHKLATYITDLKAFVGKTPIDVLVITHEHKDHVYGFEVCEDLFLNDPDFTFKEIWMGWPENDNADDKVKEWKRDYGQRKKALKLAAQRLTAIVESDTEKRKLKKCLMGWISYKFVSILLLL